MKKFIPLTSFLVMLFALSTSSFSQTKKDMLTKNWKYAGVEEFGVVRPPDSTMMRDAIELKADGSYNMIKNGKKTSGTWSLNEKAAIIIFTDAKTKKNLNYNLKSVDENGLVVEYQTPDLVRSRYHYQLVK
jgi:hypothetical protein